MYTTIASELLLPAGYIFKVGIFFSKTIVYFIYSWTNGGFFSKTTGQTEAALSDVLAFWTGASTIPPHGFSKELEINFVHGDPGRLPVSHTC